MAGSITVTSANVGPSLDKYTIAWVSDGAGAVSGNTFAIGTCELMQVTYKPDGGATQPSDAYDVTMTDALGVDVLGGTGANLSQSASTHHVAAVSTYFRRHLEAGNLTPVVANAGNAKGGTIVLLVRRTG